MAWCLDCHRNPENALRPLDQITNLGWNPEHLDAQAFLAKNGKPPANEKSDGFVDLADEGKFIHFVFEEFLRAKGDGFDGHVVTIGHALSLANARRP